MNIIEAIRFYEEKYLSGCPSYSLWVDIEAETMLKFKIMRGDGLQYTIGYVNSPDMNEPVFEYVQLDYIFSKMEEILNGVFIDEY